MTLKRANIGVGFGGLLAVALACLVMYGWHSGNQALVQVNPVFAPMQYNTALGFLLCGFGIIAAAFKAGVLARLFGIAALGLGAATLSQYILDIDLGIDELLMDPVFITKTSHAGRPSPMTALCFTLCGLALSSFGYKRALVMSAALAACVLGLMSLIGHLFPHEELHGLGNLTRMAIHTSLGFLFVSISLITYCLWGAGEEKFDFWQIAPFSIAMVVAVLSIFSCYIIEEEAHARNQEYLQNLISDTQIALEDRYFLYEEALRGVLGLYYASKSVERAEIKKYVKALKVEEHLPGINGLGYIDYVLAQDLEAYLEKTRADDAPDFENKPDTFYPDKFIIKFIEPVENNKQAVGLDIGFEANRRAAAERARDLGVPALTKKILLVQDHKQQAGFLLLLPVYATKDTPPSIEARREHFQGWVYAPFIGPNFFAGIASVNKNQLYLEVFDGEKKTEETLIFVDPGYDHDKYHKVGEEKDVVVTQMKIGGRTWTLEWYPNENFTPPASENLGLVFLVFGLGFAAFLYFTLERLIHSKELISQKVTEKTAELKQASDFQELITNSIPDFIFVKDEDLKIIKGNKAFLNLYPEESRAQIIGTTTAESYSEEEADAFFKQDRIALREGYSETEETIHFPDGEVRTLFTKKIRFTDEGDNKFILGIGTDLTTIKNAQIKLQQNSMYNDFLISNIPYLIFHLNEQGIIVKHNNYAETFLKTLGTSKTEKNWLSLFKTSFKSVQDFEKNNSFKTTSVDINGGIKHTFWNVIKISKDQYQCSYILIGKDMTEHQKTESAKIQKQKMQALGHLSGGIAHNLNNYLQPVLMSASMLKKDFSFDPVTLPPKVGPF